MTLADSLHLAVQALQRNRSRAALTTLGVVIGVGSVIAMMSVGAGARERIAAQLEQMGAKLLVVRAGSAVRSGIRAGAGTAKRLRLSDAAAIGDLAGVSAVLPQVDSSVQVRYRGSNWATRVRGTASHDLWPVVMGEFFTGWHVTNAAPVCVLGETVVRELFGLSDPVGETVLVKNVPCRVLGVLSKKGASSWGHDQDDVILAPVTMVQRKIRGQSNLDRILVIPESRDDVPNAESAIRQLMRERHRLVPGKDDDFRIHNRSELAKASEQSAQVFTWLLGSVASVSLIVGGIGIMNMMLISVTSRTREIGVRMALGARPRDILLQFLLEAMLLCGVGGLLGIVVGFVTAMLLGRFSGLPVSITVWSIAIAFLFAVLVGVFFGLYPARKAAGMQPVDALRYE